MFMRTKYMVIIGLASFTSGIFAANAASTEKISHGEINWSERSIIVTGSAAPSSKASNAAEARLGAERAAKLDAWRNIVEAVKGVKITAKQTVNEQMIASPEIMAKVQGILRNFKIIDTKYYSDGGVDVIVKMPLDGALITTVMPKADKVTVPNKGTATHTGLIIDAKGLSVKPAMAPRLLDKNGKAIYWAAMLTPQAINKNGIASYERDVASAKKNSRVGANPLVLKAKDISGEGTDIVLAETDAALLTDVNKNVSYLSQGKVIIVID